MSQQDAGARPSQVTIAGWVIAVASVMLVISVFDTMGNLNSVDTRDQVTRALTTGSARDLGLSVDDALEVMRWSLFVSGAAAAVTAILGIFVLQRHTAARVVLTVAAVPVVLTSPFSGGFLGVLVGASAAMLWTRPARDWFAGRPVTQSPWSPFSRAREETPRERAVPPAFRPLPPSGAVGPLDQPDSSEPAGETPPPPPPMPGWGGAAGPTSAVGSGQHGRPVGADWPPPYAHALTTPLTAGTTQQVPTQVRVACILTWVFAGLSAAGYVLLGVAIAVDRGEMLELMRENASVQDTSLSDDTLIAALVVVSALTVIWCLAACVLAALVWRRHLWAWRLLLVSAGVAAAVCLLALPLSLLHLAACGVSVGLLVRPSTRAWIRGADRLPGPGAGSGPGSGPGSWQPPSGPPREVPTPQPGDKPPVW